MKIILTFPLPFLFLQFINTQLLANADFRLYSPDNKIEASITTGRNGVFYSIKVDDQQIVNASELNLQLQNGLNICTGAILTGQIRRSSNTVWENRLGKSRYVNDHYNEITLL